MVSVILVSCNLSGVYSSVNFADKLSFNLLFDGVIHFE